MAEKEYISLDTAYDIGALEDWYINSVSQDDAPVLTEEHLKEMLNDFYVIPKDTPTADVTPICHGHWNVGYFHDRVCSCCLHPDNDLNDYAHSFCPNCGAKMDDEERIDKNDNQRY